MKREEFGVQGLSKIELMKMVDDEFISSLPKNTGKSKEMLFTSFLPSVESAMDLSHEDKIHFAKLMKQYAKKGMANNFAFLVEAVKQDKKMTGRLLQLNAKNIKYKALQFSDEDIKNAAFSNYINKASIYATIKVFEENVPEKYNLHMVDAVNYYSVKQREKLINSIKCSVNKAEYAKQKIDWEAAIVNVADKIDTEIEYRMQLQRKKAAENDPLEDLSAQVRRLKGRVDDVEYGTAMQNIAGKAANKEEKRRLQDRYIARRAFQKGCGTEYV